MCIFFHLNSSMPKNLLEQACLPLPTYATLGPAPIATKQHTTPQETSLLKSKFAITLYTSPPVMRFYILV